MSAADLAFASAAEIARLVGRRAVSAQEVLQVYLDRIDAYDRKLNAFTRVLAEPARTAARAADDAVRGGAPGPLAGVPIAVKDLIDVAGVPTTAGAHPRFHALPAADAPVVARLRRAGATIVGKTGLHEFAYGVTNVNPHFGPVRNPWDPSRIPGGSSGGSAAAVAAGLCAAALGTDTGGSVRIPAALCGVVGLKPAYGRVSTSGVVPLAWSLDHVGPMTRTVGDAALLFRVMADLPPDPSDRRRPRRADRPDAPLVRGLRVGVPRGYFWEQLDDAVDRACRAALDTLVGLGAAIVETAIPHTAEMGSAVAVIMSAEATAAHARNLVAHGDAYGEDVRVRLDRGFFAAATDYLAASRARTLFIRECAAVLATVDVLVTPTTICAATPIPDDRGAAASLAMSPHLTRCTSVFNLTGLPALSVPCGVTREGLPVGLQIVGRAHDEATVLRLGEAYEQATEWHRKHPQLRKTEAGNG